MIVRDRLDRRAFIQGAWGALLGLAVVPAACRRARNQDRPSPATTLGFPLLEISGSPYQVGLAIGRRFGDRIRKGLWRRKEWFAELRRFMEQDLASRYAPFLEAAKRYLPEVVEELRGWADGSQVPFQDLMALNLKAELGAMMRKIPQKTPGCSTLSFAHRDRLLLAHNEDGDQAYSDLMFLVKVTPPQKPTFWCLTYPGILSGNGPAMNDAGLVVTTNFIGGLAVRPGIPRYFLSRALLQASSLDEAVRIVTHPKRAFAFHYNLGSRQEKKILSVETSVERFQVRRVDGLYVHTNHLVLPEMKHTPQDTRYVETSSMSRYRILAAKAEHLRGEPEDITADILVQMLSSHQGSPYSPCRHPVETATEPIRGITLANALFDVRTSTCRLSVGNPCKGLIRLHSLCGSPAA